MKFHDLVEKALELMVYYGLKFWTNLFHIMIVLVLWEAEFIRSTFDAVFGNSDLF